MKQALTDGILIVIGTYFGYVVGLLDAAAIGLR